VNSCGDRSASVETGLAPPGLLVSLPGGTTPPDGAWNLILMDHSDQQGALRYHEEANGTAILYAEVFALDAVSDSSTASALASHQALEIAVGPNVANVRTQLRGDTQQIYIVESATRCRATDARPA
jgi:hypothetical protein